MRVVSPGNAIDRLGAVCAKVGFDLHAAAPMLRSRLRLLAERSETASDCERMTGLAERFFAREPFSAEERRVVVLGCVFSDIGKTGPVSADESGQRLITEMFAVEGVKDDQQTVGQFLAAFFPDDSADRLERFVALGLDPELKLRAFWNLHSTWTLQIVESAGVPREAVAAAATHHLLDDINPGAIVGADQHFTRPFGSNVAFDRAEKLVILLDKYDALRRRGRRRHEQAVAWLRERVRGSRRFHDDAEFAGLLDQLSSALSGTDDVYAR